MAALKEIAREYATEIRDGIGWVIVYRTGRSWNALTVWSDLGNNEWETDDINDALEALCLDPRAVALNGYYLGHFGDMTIDDIDNVVTTSSAHCLWWRWAAHRCS